MSLVGVEATWEYQVDPSNTAPVDPSAWAIPSAGYAFGKAPFGTLGSLVIEHPINTTWAANTGLWLRRNLDLNGLAPVLLTGRVENSLWVYWDGVFVGSVNPGNSDRPETTLWYLVIPASLASEGVHELAIYCADEAATGAGDAAYVFCEADYIPALISVPPQAPVRETLAWKTDVQESFDGSEERLQVRLSPRQEFEYNYPAQADRKTVLFNTLYGAWPDRWLVPVWTQAQSIGAVTAGLQNLAVTTAYSEFRASSLALLWESPDRWQLVGIDLVGGSSLTFVGLTEAFDNAWIMPVRFARIVSNVEKGTNAHRAEFSVNYEVLDNAALAVSAPTQFLGEDFYTDEILMTGESVSDNLIRRVEVLDEALGAVAFRSPWNYTRVSRPFRKIAANAAEAWAIRQWLHRRAGRYKAFWQPSFEADLRLLSSGTITGFLVVAADEYRRHAADRTHLAVETADGSWYARTITLVNDLGNGEIKLTLDSNLNVAASSVLRVCYLGLKRLDADRVQITWPGGGVAQVDVRMMELNP